MHVHTINATSLSRASQATLFARRAADQIRHGNYDLVHAITPCDGADIYQPRGGTVTETVQRNLAIRKGPTSRKIKKLVNHLNLKQRRMLHLERRLFHPRGRCVVAAVSDYVAWQLRTHYQLGEERIRVIFNAVDPDASSAEEREAHRHEIRHMYGVGPQDCVVLLMAHNFKLKGVGCWIDALTELARDGDMSIRSWVVGKEDPRRWQRIVERRGLEHCIRFVGPTRRAAAFRHAADVLVHPTYYDPCSRVVLESLASGLPCITTRFDGSSEIIDDGVNGMIVDSPTDVAALVHCVRQLAEPQRRIRMSEATASLRDRISMQRHASEMFKLYQEVSNGVLAR